MNPIKLFHYNLSLACTGSEHHALWLSDWTLGTYVKTGSTTKDKHMHENNHKEDKATYEV
jgi:hypothetical protein